MDADCRSSRRRWPLPATERHRHACIATYAPVAVYVAAYLATKAPESGFQAWLLVHALLTLTGPGLWIVSGKGFFLAPLFLVVTPVMFVSSYFVVARHDVGTMPWSWFLALSTAWCSVCWWMSEA